MLNIVISFLTFVLIIVSLFLVLVILMQRANTNAGMGSAFGGGVTESAFGAETTNILTRATKWSAVAFFLLSLGLYLLYMSREGKLNQPSDAELPDIVVESEPAAAAPEASPTIPMALPEEAGTLPTTPQEVPVDSESPAEETAPVPAP